MRHADRSEASRITGEYRTVIAMAAGQQTRRALTFL